MPTSFSRRLFWFIIGINFLNYIDRYTLPAVLEPLGRDLLLNDEQRGVLGSVFLISYMVAAPFFGLFGDKYCRPKIISVAIALWSISTSLTMFVTSYNQLLLLRAFVGIGEAAYYGLGLAMLCDIIPEKERAGKLTFFFLAIPLGSAIGFGISGLLAQHFGWRTSFLIAGLPGVFLALGMWFVKDPVRGANDLIKDAISNFSPMKKMSYIFTNRIFVITTISYIFYTFGMGALTHWSASFLEREHLVSTGHAGLIVGGMAAVAGIGGTFLGGFVTQKWQDKYKNIDVYISVIAFVLGAVGIGCYLLSSSLIIVYLSLFAGMFLLFINTTPVNNLTVTALPASVRAWGTSINVFLIHVFGDALSPGIVGIISDANGATGRSLGNALLISVPAFILAGVVLLLAKKKKTAALI